MAKGKKVSTLLIYNLLVKEVAAINKNLPEDRKLSIKDRYEFISKKLWPTYKNIAKSKIRLRELRDFIYWRLRRWPRKKGCDVLALMPEIYANVEYYAIEEFISKILPGCIYIRVNGNKFGSTNIFSTRDYDYYASGIGSITNNINSEARRMMNRRRNAQTYFYYAGVVQVRPDKKDDGNPDNYFLDMILQGPNIEEFEPEPVKFKKSKKTAKQKKSEKDLQKFVRERVKALKAQKSFIKRLRSDTEKRIYNTNGFIKGIKSFSTEEYRLSLLKKVFDSELKKFKKHLASGKINEKQYQSLVRRITKGYAQ